MSLPPSRYDEFAAWYADKVDSLLHARYRDEILGFIGDVAGQTVLDVACGEGVWARALAERGAIVTAIDLSEQLLAIARERTDDHDITYIHDDAQSLTCVTSASVDGAMCIMAVMDIDDTLACFHAVHRAVKPGGWFVLVLLHPCFETPHSSDMLIDNQPARIVSRYLTEGRWSSKATGVRSRLGAHHRTLSTYLNDLVRAGWRIDELREPPMPDDIIARDQLPTDIPSMLFIKSVVP